MDLLSKKHRSRNMSQIRGKDTLPEKTVRSILHGLGYRFRIHRKDLPGKPDIVLPCFHAVIFVHGCFWHHHSGCKYAYTPKSRVEFWTNKFEQNARVHQRAANELQELGWRVIVIWECELSDLDNLKQRILAILPKRILHSQTVRS